MWGLLEFIQNFIIHTECPKKNVTIAICFCKLPQQPDFNASVRYYDQHSKFWSTRSTWKRNWEVFMYHWKALCETFHSDVFDAFHKLASEQIADCFLNQSSKQLHTLALSLKFASYKFHFKCYFETYKLLVTIADSKSRASPLQLWTKKYGMALIQNCNFSGHQNLPNTPVLLILTLELKSWS